MAWPPKMLTPSTLLAHLRSPMLAESYSVVSDVPYLIVQAQHEFDALTDEWIDAQDRAADTRIVRPACPIIGFGAYGGDNGVVDVWAEDEAALRLITEAIDKQPLACACLAQLLRHNAHANVPDGLFAESLTYSTLQQSLGFRDWQNERTDPLQNAEPAQGTEPVIVERTGANLNITLNRPRQHNAYSAQMRDDLCAALHLAHTDTTITEVVLAGNGPSFCAGGDLGEFGQVTDAAQAHLSRTTRSAGYLLATLPTQATVKLHGACIGAGIEVPAFANQLQATPETFFQLPEVTFGLVPGAGGTVSVCQRIGPTRTNYMAITGSRIDTTTALNWGLIDAIVDAH